MSSALVTDMHPHEELDAAFLYLQHVARDTRCMLFEP